MSSVSLLVVPVPWDPGLRFTASEWALTVQARWQCREWRAGGRGLWPHDPPTDVRFLHSRLSKE